MVLFGCRSLTYSDCMCETQPARQQNLCKTSEGEPRHPIWVQESYIIPDLLVGQCQQETRAMGKEVSGKDVEHRIFGQSIKG